MANKGGGGDSRLDRRLRGWFTGQFGQMGVYHPGGNSITRVSAFDPSKETVLLTQGLVQTRGVMDPLERRLRADGYEVFSLHLGGLFNTWNTLPIPRIARHLAGKVRRLRGRHGLGRIHMIGHSKGGLVGRYFLQMLGGEQHLKTLITLGSPHTGTPTAYIAALPAVSAVLQSGPDMLPGSTLIRTLTAAPRPLETRVVSIYSRTDLICPYWCSWLDPRLGGTVRNFMVHGPGHTELLSDLRVYRLIQGELKPDFAL